MDTQQGCGLGGLPLLSHLGSGFVPLSRGGGVAPLSANNLHRFKTNKRFLCKCVFRREMGGNRHFIKSRDYERLAI